MCGASDSDTNLDKEVSEPRGRCHGDRAQEILQRLDAVCGDDINHHQVDDDLATDMDNEGNSGEDDPHVQEQARVKGRERQDLDYAAALRPLRELS